MSLPSPTATERVLVIDFGAQYSQLIARRVRECKVFCELISYENALEQIKEKQPVGIILSGGPSSVYEGQAPTCDPEIYKLGIPILGICYGMQIMAQQLGGEVLAGDRREYGKTEL